MYPLQIYSAVIIVPFPVSQRKIVIQWFNNQLPSYPVRPTSAIKDRDTTYNWDHGSHTGKDWSIPAWDRRYVDHVGHFFVANDISEEDKKTTVFLTCIGAETYQLLRNPVSPGAPRDKTFTDLVAKLKEHYSQTPSEVSALVEVHTKLSGCQQVLGYFKHFLLIVWPVPEMIFPKQLMKGCLCSVRVGQKLAVISQAHSH